MISDKSRVRSASLCCHEIEKISQFLNVSCRIVKPLFVFYYAEIEIARIAKEIDHVNEPAIFPVGGIEAITRIERSGDLHGIAQAQHNLWRQFQLIDNLMPHRHQPHRARIFEAEIGIADSPFEKHPINEP